MRMTDFIPKPLRILLLEDNQLDAELVRARLKRDKLPAEITHVPGREDFRRALSENRFDVILADCSLPDFDGFEALQLVRESESKPPFIFVTGTFDEELVIKTIKSGATDYVLKDDLARLAFAVRRAVHDQLERKKSERGDQALAHLAGSVASA